MKSSCALTLAKKLKVKRQGAIFKKFGELLECPETGTKLFKPSTLKAIHEYWATGTPDNLDLDLLSRKTY